MIMSPDTERRQMTVRPAAVLFDLDGTLIDTIPHILASFRYATEQVFGSALSDEELLYHVGIPLIEQMRLMTQDEAIAQRLVAVYREFNHRTHDQMAKLYPGTIETLTWLESCGMTMGVVTSKGRPMATRGIELFGLSRFFETVVTADDVTKHKPDPCPVLHAAAQLGVAASDCVFIGDSPHDITAGNSAGSLTMGAVWGVAGRERLAEASPDFMLETLGGLRDLLTDVCVDGVPLHQGI